MALGVGVGAGTGVAVGAAVGVALSAQAIPIKKKIDKSKKESLMFTLAKPCLKLSAVLTRGASLAATG